MFIRFACGVIPLASEQFFFCSSRKTVERKH
jgi:hypothetical protein